MCSSRPTVCALCALIWLCAAISGRARGAERSAPAVDALEAAARAAFGGAYDETSTDAPERLLRAFEVYSAARRELPRAAHADPDAALRLQSLVVQFHEWRGHRAKRLEAFGELLAMVARAKHHGPRAAAKLALRNADAAFGKKRYAEAAQLYLLVAGAAWASSLDEAHYARFQYGVCQRELGIEGAAFAAFVRLVNDHPESDWAARGMLRAQENYFALRLLDRAGEVQKRLLAANPNGKWAPYLMEDMAFNLIMQKRYDEAEKILRTVIARYKGLGASRFRPEGMHVAYAKGYLKLIAEKRAHEEKN